MSVHTGPVAGEHEQGPEQGPGPIVPAADDGERAGLWAWGVCGLLLLATMLMYMDRQALSQQQVAIGRTLGLSNADYGRLEKGFGLAFATGGIITGLLADKINPRWLYPCVLLGWSGVGFATGWATTYRHLLICRVLLGFFEAGHWPCALITAQRLLSRRDRALGNSVLQSGASLGAMATPLVVLLLDSKSPESWRLPFRVIGGLGVIWVFAWLATIGRNDLKLNASRLPALADEDEGEAAEKTNDASGPERSTSARDRWTFVRRFLALTVVVIVINWCWQYFRAWMPGMLEKQYGYSERSVQWFSIAYYVAADVGCLLSGLWIKRMAERGVSVHGARMAAFFVGALLTALSVWAARVPASPLFLGLLLMIGFGSLAQFPAYYAFTQELTVGRLGKVTGALSFLTWTATALVQEPIGEWIDRTHSYSLVTLLAGLLPMLGLLAMLALWNAPRRGAAQRA